MYGEFMTHFLFCLISYVWMLGMVMNKENRDNCRLPRFSLYNICFCVWITLSAMSKIPGF